MVLVDTNVWLAAADRRARDHRSCVALLDAHRADLASTALVIAETGWLLLDRDGPGAQRRFIGSVLNGDIVVIDLTEGDWQRVWELCGTYADLGLDLIDASTVAVAERLGETAIATLDRRDFSVVRPSHAAAFDLLPELGPS